MHTNTYIRAIPKKPSSAIISIAIMDPKAKVNRRLAFLTPSILTSTAGNDGTCWNEGDPVTVFITLLHFMNRHYYREV